MAFKNNIRLMAAIVGNTLLKAFFITLRVSSGGMESISCWILSFKSSRDRGRYLKNLFLQVSPKEKVTQAFRPSAKRVRNAESQNGCSHNTLHQQSADVHRSNPLWVLKTVEANQPNDTTPTSLPLPQPAQRHLEMWEIFMPHPVDFEVYRVGIQVVTPDIPTHSQLK